MQRRVCFRSEEMRRNFFRDIKQLKHLKTNLLLAQYLGTSKSIVDSYIAGKLTLPEGRFLKLMQVLPKQSRQVFSQNIFYKDGNWGRRKGGRSTYTKHKEIFDYGRMLPRKNVTQMSDLKIELNSDLCEFIGAFIGDGFIGRYGKSSMLQITGDATLDLDYYQSKLIPIAQKAFPTIRYRLSHKDNTLRLTFYSKALVSLFNERFLFPIGKKCYTVRIPDEIAHSSQERVAATLRGIFDTDGCFFFDNRSLYRKPYIRIALHLSNPGLIGQVQSLLGSFGIASRTTKNNGTLYVNGVKNVVLFVRKIGSSNERHLSKIRKISLRRDLNPRPAVLSSLRGSSETQVSIYETAA